VGVTAAFLAFLVGRSGANGYLVSRVRRVLRAAADRPATEPSAAP
jgi:hypothetical protein